MNAQSSPLTALLSNLTKAMTPDPNALAPVRLPPPAAHLPAAQPSDGSLELTGSPPALPILHARPRTGAVASLPRDKRLQVEAKYTAGARLRLIDSPAESPAAPNPNTTAQHSTPPTTLGNLQ